MGSSFGKLFRITTWGESHGPAIGVVVDGCPPGIELNEEHLQVELDRRRPGQSPSTCGSARTPAAPSGPRSSAGSAPRPPPPP